MHGQRDGGSACVRVYVCMCVCVHVCMCVCVLICAPCRPGQVGEELSILREVPWGRAPPLLHSRLYIIGEGHCGGSSCLSALEPRTLLRGSCFVL